MILYPGSPQTITKTGFHISMVFDFQDSKSIPPRKKHGSTYVLRTFVGDVDPPPIGKYATQQKKNH